MKRYFSAHRPFRKVPDLLKVLSLSKRSNRRSRVCSEAAGLEPAESPELVIWVEGAERAAPPLFLPASMQKMIQKSPKYTHFYSFLPTLKCNANRISATNPATNTISPAIIQPKSRKVAKNYPIARISSARSLRFPAAVGAFSHILSILFIRKGIHTGGFARTDSVSRRVFHFSK